MDKRFRIFLLTIALAGCAAMVYRARSETTNPSNAALDRDELSIYESLVRTLYFKDEIHLIVVRDLTVPGNVSDGPLSDQVKRAAHELPDLSRDTVADFLQKNKEQYPLLTFPGLNVDVKKIDQSEIRAIFEQGRGWEEFYQRYPHSQGVLEVSKPGFNGDRTQALVYVANQGSWKGGAGYYVLLFRSSQSWKLEKRYTSWVS